jgi:hypothetical protein
MEVFLAVVALVLSVALIVGALTRHAGSGSGTAAISPAPSPVPAAAPAAAPSQVAAASPAPSTMPAAQTQGGMGSGAMTQMAMGGPNLIANPGFETGLDGWRPLGGATLRRTATAKEGGFSASFATGSTSSPGISFPSAGKALAKKSYSGTVWVYPTAPGTLIELRLVEYQNGQRLAVDTVGEQLNSAQWQPVQVVHLAHRPGDTLGLEVLAPGLPLGSPVLVDGASIQAKSGSYMSLTTTTR